MLTANPLTVDANVWVAAADPGDEFSARSRAFLRCARHPFA